MMFFTYFSLLLFVQICSFHANLLPFQCPKQSKTGEVANETCALPLTTYKITIHFSDGSASGDRAGLNIEATGSWTKVTFKIPKNVKSEQHSIEVYFFPGEKASGTLSEIRMMYDDGERWPVSELTITYDLTSKTPMTARVDISRKIGNTWILMNVKGKHRAVSPSLGLSPACSYFVEPVTGPSKSKTVWEAGCLSAVQDGQELVGGARLPCDSEDFCVCRPANQHKVHAVFCKAGELQEDCLKRDMALAEKECSDALNLAKYDLPGLDLTRSMAPTPLNLLLSSTSTPAGQADLSKARCLSTPCPTCPAKPKYKSTTVGPTTVNETTTNDATNNNTTTALKEVDADTWLVPVVIGVVVGVLIIVGLAAFALWWVRFRGRGSRSESEANGTETKSKLQKDGANSSITSKPAADNDTDTDKPISKGPKSDKDGYLEIVTEESEKRRKKEAKKKKTNPEPAPFAPNNEPAPALIQPAAALIEPAATQIEPAAGAGSNAARLNESVKMPVAGVQGNNPMISN